MAIHSRRIILYCYFLLILLTLSFKGIAQVQATVATTAMSLEKAFLAVAYSPSHEVIVYSIHNTNELARLSGKSAVDSIFFNEADQHIVLIREDKLEIWNYGTFTKEYEMPLDRSIKKVAYAKAKHTIAYINTQDEIVLVDLREKKQKSKTVGNDPSGEYRLLEDYAIKMDQQGNNIYLGTTKGILKLKTDDFSLQSALPLWHIDAFDIYDETIVVMGQKGIPGGIRFYNTSNWDPISPETPYTTAGSYRQLQLINDNITFLSYPDKMALVVKNGFEMSIKLPPVPQKSMFILNVGILTNYEKEVILYDIEGEILCRIAAPVLNNDVIIAGPVSNDIKNADKDIFPGLDKPAKDEIFVNQSGEDQHLVGYATTRHQLKIYNVKDQKLVQTIPTGERSFAQYLQISASNDLVAAMFGDKKKIKLYDIKSNKLIDSILFDKAPSTLKIKNNWLVVGMEDGRYASWKITSKKLAAAKGLSIGLSHPVTAIEVEGNTAIIASCARMLHVSLEEDADFKENLIIGHANYINQLSLDRSGHYLASSDVLGNVYLWDFKNNTLLETFLVPDTRRIKLKDNLDIAVLTAYRQLLLDNSKIAQRTESPKPEILLQTSNTGSVNSLAISPNGKFVASIDGNVVKVRDLKTSFLISQFTPQNNTVNDIVFTNDSKIVIVAGGNSIEYFDCVTGKSRKLKDLRARNRSIHSISSFPITNALILNNHHNWHNPLFIHTNSGMNLGELYFNEKEEKDKTIIQVKVSKDEKYLATYGSHYIKIFSLDVNNLNNIEQLIAIPREDDGEGYNFTMRSYLSFSEDSRFLSFYQFGDGTNYMIVYDILNQKEHYRTEGNMSIFGTDKQLLYMHSATRMTTINLDDNVQQRLRPNADHFQIISALGYDKNSNIFVSGDDWGNLKLWNAHSGNVLREINRFDYDIYQSEMSNDGRFMAYNSKNGIYLFDIVSFKNIKLDGNNYPFIATFSNDSQYFYYRKDNSLYAYNLKNGEVKPVLQLGPKTQQVDYSKPKISDDGLHFIVNLTYDGQSAYHIYNLSDFVLKDTISHYSISRDLDGFTLYSMHGDNLYGVGMTNEENKNLVNQYISYNLLTGVITPISKKIYHELVDNEFNRTHLVQNLKVNTISKNKKWYAYQENYHLKIESLTDGQILLDQDFNLFDITSGTFTSDENYFILGLRNGYIRIYSTETFAVVKEIYIGNGEVLSLATNAQFLTVSGEDKIRHVFDMNKNFEEVYALAFMYDGDFVIMDPEGYYFSTLGAIESIAFKRGEEIYPFEQFDLYYNRPDKVAEKLVPYNLKDPAMANAYREAYHKRLSRLGLKEEQLSGSLKLPQVHINTAHIPVTVQDDRFSFAVNAKDEVSNIDKMHVWVNDVPIYGGNGKDIAAPQKEVNTEVNMNLIKGKNKIQVAVVNANGVESLKETFVVNCDIRQEKPTLHLISIGVSRYQNTQYNLQYAVKDATDIGLYAQTLTDRYREVKVYNLFDEEATTKKILGLKEKLASANTNDLVIVFFAGHGLLDDKLNYYLGTHDVDFENPSVNGLPYESLENLLDGIRPFQKLLLIDACHSGEVDKEDVEVMQTGHVDHNDTAILKRGSIPVESKTKKLGLKNSFELMQTIFADVRRGTGAVVISASGGLEYALESNQWNNGVFTYSLLEGLRSGKADTDADGKIQVSELRNYVTEKVTEYTKGGQTPTARKVNLEFDFEVW